MITHLLCSFTNSDWISAATALITLFILAVGYWQLRAFKKSENVKFTYKVDEDFADFLNNPDNKKAKEWLLNDGVVNEGEYDLLRQLFDEMEAVYSLMKKGVIDDDIFYDLLSHYVECFFIGKQTPSGKEFIEVVRKEAKNEGFAKPDEIYYGIELLYKKVIKMAENRPPEPTKI